MAGCSCGGKSINLAMDMTVAAVLFLVYNESEVVESEQKRFERAGVH